MVTNNQIKIKHLHSRATFGIRYSDLDERKNWTINKAVDELFKDSKSESPLTSTFDYNQVKEAKMLSEENKRMLVKQAREAIRSLNITWLANMANSKEQLREKMTLLWHGHFACRSQNPTFLVELNNIHRKHALGSFRRMVHDVAKAPAMLQFLNNQQNRKGHPNENFARELMELFTLGRGNYTETDIKESARAFTGWNFNRMGEYQFRPAIHDDGEKAFFGKKGNFNGNDIIDIILEKPEAARFVAGKIYKHLVSDTPDAARINELGDYFYKEDYNIGKLVRKILMSDWFYADRIIGSKIKSPVEFLVGINRQFMVNYQSPNVLLQFQNALGQTLFYPPNVAGWPGGRNWIDSSSLMLRLKIPSLILNAGQIDFTGKADPEDEAELSMMRIKRNAIERRVAATTQWDEFAKQFPAGSKPEHIAEFLLQCNPNANVINSSATVKNAAIEIVSTPEFQLT